MSVQTKILYSHKPMHYNGTDRLMYIHFQLKSKIRIVSESSSDNDVTKTIIT